METTTNTGTKAHPFTAAGLGAAPFLYLGEQYQAMAYGQRVVETLPGGAQITTKPGGTCAYCGTYIVSMHNVRSADGKLFHVGIDCLQKVYGPTHWITKTAKRISTTNRTVAKLADCAQALATETVRAALAAQPHPNAGRAARGETLLDSVEWMMAHAGTTGKLKTARTVLSLASAVRG